MNEASDEEHDLQNGNSETDNDTDFESDEEEPRLGKFRNLII